MLRILVLLSILLTTAPDQAAAQNSERNYVVGIRSALILESMNLSGLDAAFDDLAPDGLEGPHISGFFLLFKVRQHLRVGVETLVANSDQDSSTSMSYQAAGPVVGLTYGDSWFVAGGVHAGGLIVNAVARQGPAPSEGATSGSFYKGSGGFFAPYVDIGRRFGRNEFAVFVKPVMIFGESDRGGLGDFSASFAGVRYAIGL